MKKIIFGFIGLLLVLALFSVPLWQATAATDNPSPGSPGYMALPFTVGSLNATNTPITFRMPWPARVVGITAHAKTLDTASGNETYTVDVQAGGASILTGAVNMAAQNTIYAASVNAPAIADEATVSVVVTLGGTTPSMENLTVLMLLKRQ